METVIHTRERWASQRFVIGRIGRSALAEPLQDASENPERPSSMRLFQPQDAYERLGLQRAVAFQGMDSDKVMALLSGGSKELTDQQQQERQAIWEKLTASTSVVYGFMVTARTLGYAAETYASYCDDTGLEATVAGLETILRNPKSFENTAKFLALMPIRPNNNGWEQAAHLRDSLYKPYPGYTPFVVTDSDEGPYLTFSRNTRLNAMFEVMNSSPSETPTPGECPAAEVFLPKLWQQMVTDCVSDPELFQADLNRLSSMEAR